MIVSLYTYYAIMAILALLIAAKPLYARFVKKQGNKYDAMYFLVLVLLPVNWCIPRVVTVTNCGEYKKEVALVPITHKGKKLSYWKKTMIVNESTTNLWFEFIYYGNKERQEDELDHKIAPEENVIIPNLVIDYLFEQPEERVSSKSDGARKTYLNCMQNDNTMNKPSFLNNVLWHFTDKEFTDTSIFSDAVSEYHLAIKREPDFWQPEEIVFSLPQVKILYEAWINGQEDLLPNEILIEDEQGAFEMEDGMYQVEILATLDADNGKEFTAVEFLMKVHNQLANKELGDHIFFEGVEEISSPGTEVPVYYIMCGS